MKRHFPLRRALLACGVALASLPAAAQSGPYPNRPVTLVVGYPPGGSTDFTARVLADQLSRRLGVAVVVDNASGAGGAIGALKVSKAAADGYTLFLGSNNELVINRLISPATVRYSFKDFTPLGMVASQPMVLVASTASGLRNVDQLIKAAKARPGRYSFGSSGVGTALHLAGELVKEQAGIYVTHIPYRGVSPLTTDLVGGAVELGVFVLSSGLPQIKAGKVVALGVTEKQRSPIAPDIPALAEHPALKAMDLTTWFALMAPPGLPEPLSARLRKALADSLQAPELRSKLEEAGSIVNRAQPPDMLRFMADEAAKYQKIVTFANIKE